MYFDAQLSGNTIIIKSDESWSCTVYGSVILSKYSGKNDDALEMSFKDDMQYCSGKIMFTHGDDKCDYPSIDVYMTNNCWIRTEPMFDENKYVCIPFENDNEMVSLKVFSNGVWNAIGEGTYKDGDKLLIAAKNGKKIKIYPSFNCNKPVTVELKKGAN
jgi:hypothetical protein